MAIVSKDTENALMALIKECFTMNRKLDRFVSVIGTDFAYNKTSNLIHHHIAHYFPTLADEIGHLTLERYNISVQYGSTPNAFDNYSSVKEIINLMLEEIIDFQTMFIGVNKIAFENNDLHIFADLQDLLKNYNLIVEQCILLKDKIELYDNNPSFDSHIDGFWILED